MQYFREAEYFYSKERERERGEREGERESK